MVLLPSLRHLPIQICSAKISYTYFVEASEAGLRNAGNGGAAKHKIRNKARGYSEITHKKSVYVHLNLQVSRVSSASQQNPFFLAFTLRFVLYVIIVYSLILIIWQISLIQNYIYAYTYSNRFWLLTKIRQQVRLIECKLVSSEGKKQQNLITDHSRLFRRLQPTLHISLDKNWVGGKHLQSHQMHSSHLGYFRACSC